MLTSIKKLNKHFIYDVKVGDILLDYRSNQYLVKQITAYSMRLQKVESQEEFEVDKIVLRKNIREIKKER